MRKMLLLIFTNLAFHYSYAQIDILNIAPIETDINYDADEDEHLVVRNNLSNNDKLFLFLPGTGAMCLYR